MRIADWTKLITLIIVNAGIIALGFFGIINEQGIIAVLSASLGYVFGNTHGVLENRRTNNNQNL